MNHSVKTRAYTKLAKWYNLIWLGLITLGSIMLLIGNLLGAHEADLSNLDMLRSVAIMLTGAVAISGILQEKPWAK